MGRPNQLLLATEVLFYLRRWKSRAKRRPKARTQMEIPRRIQEEDGTPPSGLWPGMPVGGVKFPASSISGGVCIIGNWELGGLLFSACGASVELPSSVCWESVELPFSSCGALGEAAVPSGKEGGVPIFVPLPILFPIEPISEITISPASTRVSWLWVSEVAPMAPSSCPWMLCALSRQNSFKVSMPAVNSS